MGKLNNVLGVNTDAIRIRSFLFNGQVLKVRVPTSKEAENIFDRTKEPSAELVEQKYQEICKPIFDAKEKLEGTEITILENDVMFQDKSMRELAKTKASTELRIVETLKLLVTGDGGRMTDLTYEDVSEDLPLPIQLELVQRITEVISPNYEESRKN